MIRFIFRLLIMSHRYLIEPISETTHLKTKLSDRFMKFCATLHSSNKSMVRNLTMLQEIDCRSDFGANVSKLCRLTGAENYMSLKKGSVLYRQSGDGDKWRVPILKELLATRKYIILYNFNDTEIQIMINDIACN